MQSIVFWQDGQFPHVIDRRTRFNDSIFPDDSFVQVGHDTSG
jgi:hypothetical protein